MDQPKKPNWNLGRRDVPADLWDPRASPGTLASGSAAARLPRISGAPQRRGGGRLRRPVWICLEKKDVQQAARRET